MSIEHITPEGFTDEEFEKFKDRANTQKRNFRNELFERQAFEDDTRSVGGVLESFGSKLPPPEFLEDIPFETFETMLTNGMFSGTTEEEKE